MRKQKLILDLNAAISALGIPDYSFSPSPAHAGDEVWHGDAVANPTKE